MRHLRRLIGRTYEAVSNPDLWTLLLDEIADAVHGEGGGFMHWDGTLSTSVSVTARVAPDHLRQYVDHYASINPWVRNGAHLFKPGVVLPGEAIMPNEELRRTEFFNDYLKPVGWAYSLGACVFDDGKWLSTMTMLRRPSVGPYTDAEIGLVSRLVPHVRQAFRLRHLLDHAELRASAFREILDCLPRGVILLDRQRRLLFSNRAAADTLAMRDGLSVFRGELVADLSAETRRLRQLIADAAATTEGTDIVEAGPIAISRRTSRPLRLLVTPVPAPLSTFGAAAAVFVIDSGARAAGLEEAWREVFRLTPAECRVAARIVDGASHREIGDALGVSSQTVRTHLKHIHRKTRVGRRSELVRRLSLRESSIR